MTQNPLLEMGKLAKQASYELMALGVAEKNALLEAISQQLVKHQERILAANDIDLAEAKENGLGEAMLDRLLLNPERLDAIRADIATVISLADPVGVELDSRLLDNGMRLSRRRIPLGVVSAIYEARPNVTVDMAVLALKTGNAVILRGGKETRHSNLALLAAISEAMESCNMPKAAVQLIDNPDRALVSALMQMDDYVDMLIPRGGAGLHQRCKEQARMPVITGGIGICHAFVDEDVDLNKVVDVVENAKVQRPTVCNALDTLLVHQNVATALLPQLTDRLGSLGVQLKGCEKALPLLGSAAQPLEEGDFDKEWLGLTLGVKVVADLNEGIAHIRQHSSEHSETILTNNMSNANRFVAAINSAAVYVNASTRYTDGSQFGLGAEVAVSTQKLHARGPMGLEALTTYKWVGLGDYHCRS